jgi:hypothetical protein
MDPLFSPPTHPAGWDDTTLLAACEVQRTRRSGPGGQHRNKVETAVVLTFRPTQARAEASERRSQADNQRVALFRLRLRLALDVRLPHTPELAPSDRWRGRVMGERIRVNSEHEDFPPLLAEALDAVHHYQGELAAAASDLGVTSSQLARLLRQHPPAWQQVNRQRLQSGRRPLK